MASTTAYLPPIGATCTVRGEEGHWRVVKHFYDGHVQKCHLESLNTGLTINKFNFEITENPTSSYQELNDFLEQVTGISQAQLSMDFVDNEVDFEFLSEPAPESIKKEALDDNPTKQKRFKSASNTDIDQLKAQNTEKTTDHQTKWAVKLLKEWMQEDGQNTTSFEWLPAEDLDALLERFYASAQTKAGKNYSKAALVGIRAGLNRHLTSPPVSRSIHLMKDREFQSSNQVLSGLVKVVIYTAV